eukprot:Skav208696  [mRNA]  locus=scaffold42:208831:209199:+ [translate_table: standard]
MNVNVFLQHQGSRLSRQPVANAHIGLHSKHQGQLQGRAVPGGNLKGRTLSEATPPLQSPLLHTLRRRSSGPKCEKSSSCCIVPAEEETAFRFDIFTETSLPQDKRTPCRPSAVPRVWMVPYF